MRILISILIFITLGSALFWFATRNSSVSIVDTFVEEKSTFEGEVVCLPHKDTQGPQTLECAYGLLGDDKNHYALRDAIAPTALPITDVPIGEHVVIQGELSTETETIYAVTGVIEIDSINVREQM